MTEIRAILSDRAKTHGDFSQTATVAQEIKDALRSGPKWLELPQACAEAADMIANKLARVVCGDPRFPDHWDDVAGYSTLAADAVRTK